MSVRPINGLNLGGISSFGYFSKNELECRVRKFMMIFALALANIQNSTVKNIELNITTANRIQNKCMSDTHSNTSLPKSLKLILGNGPCNPVVLLFQ